MKKKRLILGVSLLALLGAAFFWHCCLPAYRTYKATRGLLQARAFLVAGDVANGSLGVRQVLQLCPTNVQACELMGNLAEQARSPAALEWRTRLVALSPTVVNRLALAACSLRLERPPYVLAQRTLADLEVAGRELPSFHVLSAELALKLNRMDEATQQFRAAARLEPANALHRLNIAVLGLQSTNQGIVVAARTELQRYVVHTNLGPLAMRWLIADDLQRHDLNGAESLSRLLVSRSPAPIEDRLQRLTILQQCVRPASSPPSGPGGPAPTISPVEFTAQLGATLARARSNVVEIYCVCEWLGSHGLAEEGLEWLSHCDNGLRKTTPVQLAQARLYVARSSWENLETFLSDKRWNELEFFRLGMSAQAAWAQGHEVAAETRWREALRAAADKLSSLSLLLGLANQWGREEVLWQITHRFQREQWAARELEARYVEAGNTRALNSLYASLAGSDSMGVDVTNRNNFACTSLLLGINLAQAHRIAHELYQQHPDDVVIASTFAYSRHLQGHTSEALTVLRHFHPEALESPSVALYYGLLLASSAESERARHFFQIAKTVKLLPEERELVESAQLN